MHAVQDRHGRAVVGVSVSTSDRLRIRRGLVSGGDQHGRFAIGHPTTGREPGGHPGPILGGPVLAHFPLALDDA